MARHVDPKPTIEDVACAVCAVSGKPLLSPDFVQALANERGGEPLVYQGNTYVPIRQPPTADRDYINRMVERNMRRRAKP